jgi:hypothetical protein
MNIQELTWTEVRNQWHRMRYYKQRGWKIDLSPEECRGLDERFQEYKQLRRDEDRYRAIDLALEEGKPVPHEDYHWWLDNHNLHWPVK